MQLVVIKLLVWLCLCYGDAYGYGYAYNYGNSSGYGHCYGYVIVTASGAANIIAIVIAITAIKNAYRDKTMTRYVNMFGGGVADGCERTGKSKQEQERARKSKKEQARARKSKKEQERARQEQERAWV